VAHEGDARVAIEFGSGAEIVVISSRTPEGDPNRCAVCGRDSRPGPSWPSRDGPCPHCGHLLWFGEATCPGVSTTGEAVRQIIIARFGLPPAELESAVAAFADRADADQMLQRVLTASRLTELLAGD
jgi:hypothetical protein